MKTNGGFYLSQIKQLQDRIFERLLKEQNLDISGSQGRILFVLWRQDRLSQKELSFRTSLAKNTLSLILDGMVLKKIVRREANPCKRREVIISLTDEALEMKASYEKVSDRMTEIFYKSFDKEQIRQFEQNLLTVLNNLKAYEENETD